MKRTFLFLVLISALAALWGCSKKNPSGPGGGSGGGGGGGGGVPAIFVTSPKGGENWSKGSKHTITWTATGLSTGALQVDLSKDGGANWTTLGSGMALTVRSLSWVPEDTTHRGLVRVSDVSGSQILARDSSHAAFTVSFVSNLPYPVDSVAVDVNPYGVALTPDGNFAYVTCSVAGLVDVISTASDSVVARITVGGDPQGIVITGGFAYVANNLTNSISVISTSTQSLVNTINFTPAGPSGIAVSGRYLFTMSSFNNQLAIYDSVTHSFFTRGMSSLGVGVVTSGAKVYTTSLVASAVTDMDTVSFVPTPHFLPTGRGPSGIAIRSGGSELYVADAQSNQVSVLSLPGFTETVVALSGTPTGAAIKPAGDYAYISQNTGNCISAVNTSTKAVIGPVAVGSAPVGLAVSPNGKFVYVVNAGSNTVTVVYTNGF
jgi:YVTN family beta-propeller protein